MKELIKDALVQMLKSGEIKFEATLCGSLINENTLMFDVVIDDEYVFESKTKVTLDIQELMD